MARMTCPHCGHKALAHDRQQLDSLSHATRYACSNICCGHTFVVLTECLYTLKPSAVPDASLNLPVKPERAPQQRTAIPGTTGATRQDCHPDQLRLPEV